VRNPYITGGYVTGHKHYGRHDLIDYLLHGDNRACLVVGNRRIGKTSLLRQLELLAANEAGLIPLYWDMQGGDTAGRLSQYLVDAVRDAGERFEVLAAPFSAPPEGDVVDVLAALRRAAMRAGRDLLLLCDETEAIIKIAQEEPETAQRLHRQLTVSPGLRVVMTATRAIYRLHDVCRHWVTSPFLAGFDISQTLGSLAPQDAAALILQTQSETSVRAEPEVVDAISECANNHPYLIQLLCSRLFEPDGRLRPIGDDDLQVDPVLRGFFAVDFAALTEADRRIVWLVYDETVLEERCLQEVVDEHPAQLHQRLHFLESLGYLRRVYGQWAIGNQFLVNWLATERGSLRLAPAGLTSEAAMQKALAVHQAQETGFLVARLNAKRSRLVELETIRARDLLSVSPQVLAEIGRVQGEIAHLRQLLGEIWDDTKVGSK
jgi:hypothetical protein